MIVKLPFGKDKVELELPVGADLLESKATEYTPEYTEEELVQKALENPIGTSRVSELAKGKKNIVVITSDHTRPVPSKVTLPIYLKEIRKENPDCNITILIATGFHRPTTDEEMIDKFGKDLIENENFVIHMSQNDEDMEYLGKLPSGGDLLINKIATEADLLVSEGFIEPHFFAGFSGGRKSVLPGIASQRTVFANHCAKFIASDKSRTGNLDGNPIHKDMKFAAEQAKLAFILNVVIDADKKVIAAFAGDSVEAHEEGCQFVKDLSSIKSTEADIVITTNGGYPLDQNIYQSVKSMTAAEACAKEDGIIIEVSKCNDGHGGEGFYQTFKQAASPKDVEDEILKVKMEDTIADQWESQILARILSRHKVFFVADEGTKEILEDMHIEYSSSVEDAIKKAIEIKGKDAKIAVIPDGVSVIVNK
ncbi:nickel-dependent lactate racemase [Peptoniphilus stercorisuis]|uniref:Nickel-dependent lactate racemase n=1 Tax=Peptoniphilus stercorisuis TaxID=1436965 RepID=A0ABS4KEL2_9FIRM|nr:nickel-dependent lactate racemase [Peptoniphilus stercorisuis]MBP2025606.1 nickel-dependent lactate racemase [Peptoniphilus stercorisuis]